jgi:hypothetical protein
MSPRCILILCVAARFSAGIRVDEVDGDLQDGGAVAKSELSSSLPVASSAGDAPKQRKEDKVTWGDKKGHPKEMEVNDNNVESILEAAEVLVDRLGQASTEPTAIASARANEGGGGAEAAAVAGKEVHPPGSGLWAAVEPGSPMVSKPKESGGSWRDKTGRWAATAWFKTSAGAALAVEKAGHAADVVRTGVGNIVAYFRRCRLVEWATAHAPVITFIAVASLWICSASMTVADVIMERIRRCSRTFRPGSSCDGQEDS